MKEPLSLFSHDEALRLLFAFYACTNKYKNWREESIYSAHNRKLANKILPLEDYADYYFVLGNYFYMVSMQRIDMAVNCEIREYRTFYDLADQYLELRLTYNLLSREITRLQPVQKFRKGKNHLKIKVA